MTLSEGAPQPEIVYSESFMLAIAHAAVESVDALCQRLEEGITLATKLRDARSTAPGWGVAWTRVEDSRAYLEGQLDQFSKETWGIAPVPNVSRAVSDRYWRNVAEREVDFRLEQAA